MSRLAQIFETKRAEVAAAKAAIPESELRARARDLPTPLDFRGALESARRDLALIAEVKAASPSKGTIRSDFDPAAIARAYAQAGADALSVLTDRVYFGGAPENLAIAKAASGLPALRKDFIESSYQVYEARVWGADAFLLIVAALTDVQIADLMSLGAELGLGCLVEVHDVAEAERALALGAPLIGVNNRDLRTFETSLEVSERILPLLEGKAFAVSESALASRSDLDRVKAAGADGVLIGTTFCAAPDIESKVREVMGS